MCVCVCVCVLNLLKIKLHWVTITNTQYKSVFCIPIPRLLKLCIIQIQIVENLFSK